MPFQSFVFSLAGRFLFEFANISSTFLDRSWLISLISPMCGSSDVPVYIDTLYIIWFYAKHYLIHRTHLYISCKDPSDFFPYFLDGESFLSPCLLILSLVFFPHTHNIKMYIFICLQGKFNFFLLLHIFIFQNFFSSNIIFYIISYLLKNYNGESSIFSR